MKKIGGDQGYSGNDNRTFCRDNKIETSFTQKGRAGKNEVKNATKRELARVRATAMEGDYSGINVPLVAVCNVPPVAQCNVPPQKWLQ